MRDTEALARKFHEAYERLASEYGYETREETREFDPESPNGKLMLAVCDEIMQAYLNPWISVDERLPEGDQQVIAYHSAWGIEITQWYQNRWRYIGLGEDEPTHWMPLPNSPKE